MKTNPIRQVLLLVLLFHRQRIWADEPAQKPLVLTGKVTFAEGSFFGYSPPRAGDTIRMDLGALESITNGLFFKAAKPSDPAGYIPLLARLHIERIEQDQDGKLHLARLISGSKNSDGTERVIIDIQSTGKTGVAWVIEENDGIVMSVARLSCEFAETLSTDPVLSVPADKVQDALILDRVFSKLRPLFQRYYPNAVSTYLHADSIHYDYKVTTFELRYTGPANAMHESTSQLGPKPGGILCDVRLGKGRYAGQSDPGLRDRSNYKQLLLTPYVPKADVHLVINLSYPPGTSEEFLKRFEQIVDDLKNGAN